MTNILTATEASQFLRTDASDPVLLMYLPIVDKIIEKGTGRDWTQDNPISPVAKAAAGMLLVQQYDQSDAPVLDIGLRSVMGQLEAEALKYRKYEFEGIANAGVIPLPGAREGDEVISLVGTYLLSGDQSAKFEDAISEEDQIRQTYTGSLAEMHFVVVLKNPADDVVP